MIYGKKNKKKLQNTCQAFYMYFSIVKSGQGDLAAHGFKACDRTIDTGVHEFRSSPETIE